MDDFVSDTIERLGDRARRKEQSTEELDLKGAHITRVPPLKRPKRTEYHYSCRCSCLFSVLEKPGGDHLQNPICPRCGFAGGVSCYKIEPLR